MADHQQLMDFLIDLARGSFRHQLRRFASRSSVVTRLGLIYGRPSRAEEVDVEIVGDHGVEFDPLQRINSRWTFSLLFANRRLSLASISQLFISVQMCSSNQ
jgi:hypothetical protein